LLGTVSVLDLCSMAQGQLDSGIVADLDILRHRRDKELCYLDCCRTMAGRQVAVPYRGPWQQTADVWVVPSIAMVMRLI
jgi:hypothetical protein